MWGNPHDESIGDQTVFNAGENGNTGWFVSRISSRARDGALHAVTLDDQGSREGVHEKTGVWEFVFSVSGDTDGNL